MEIFLVDNQSIPCIARISTSSTVPTITLDLIADNQSNPGLQFRPPNLKAGSFQHSTPQAVFDQNQHSSIMQEFMTFIKADTNFIAALAVATAGSLLNLGTPIQGMPKYPPATRYIDRPSTQEALV